MTRSYVPALAAASLSAVLAVGCSGDQWLGVVIGDPQLGVSFRQGLSRGEQVAIGLDVDGLLGDFQILHAYVDWIRHEPSMKGRDVHGYWGLGVDVAAWSGTAVPFGSEFANAYFAIRVPFGIDLEVSPSGGFVIFVQLVPKVPIAENANLLLDLGAGIVFAF